MALHTKVDGDGLEGQRLAVDPLLAGEADSIPKHRLPDGPMTPEMAYDLISVWNPQTRLGRAAPRGGGPMMTDTDDSWRSVGATAFGTRLLSDLAIQFRPPRG